MDNLINILVAVIIIYSFLAPLFKQKKSGGSNTSTRPRNPDVPQAKQKPSYKGMDYDILTEIEEMMNRGKVPPVETIPEDQEIIVERLPVGQRVKSAQTIPEIKETPYEYKKFKISEDERLSLERDLEKQFTSQRKVYYNPAFARVKNSFRNKEDFKNGFIISEILGKPKALRR